MKALASSTKCENCCGRLVARKVPEYRNDTLVGIPGVVILNVVEELRCVQCGRVAATGFSNLEGLISAVAVARVEAPAKLGGRDVRFLRKALGWSSKELAAKLEVRDETVSRWENNREPVGPTSEKLLRLIVVQFLSERRAWRSTRNESLRCASAGVAKADPPRCAFVQCGSSTRAGSNRRGREWSGLRKSRHQAWVDPQD